MDRCAPRRLESHPSSATKKDPCADARSDPRDRRPQQSRQWSRLAICDEDDISRAGSHSDHIELFEKLKPLGRENLMAGHEKPDRVIAAADAANLMEERGDPGLAGRVRT